MKWFLHSLLPWLVRKLVAWRQRGGDYGQVLGRCGLIHLLRLATPCFPHQVGIGEVLPKQRCQKETGQRLNMEVKRHCEHVKKKCCAFALWCKNSAFGARMSIRNGRGLSPLFLSLAGTKIPASHVFAKKDHEGMTWHIGRT